MRVCLPITADGQVDHRRGRAARVAVAEIQDGAIATRHEFAVGWDRLHDETTEGGHHARRQANLAQPMHCWRARRHVSTYLDGELDEATRSTVERHLESCPICPPLYASLVGVRATLGGVRDPDTVVEGQIARRIHDRLQLERMPGS